MWKFYGVVGEYVVFDLWYIWYLCICILYVLILFMKINNFINYDIKYDKIKYDIKVNIMILSYFLIEKVWLNDFWCNDE